MAEEIQEAVQIIRVAYDGIEIAMKVGSGGIAAMQKAIDFLKGMLDYEKSLGKTSMRKLILKGGDLQVLQFNTEDMKKVEKMAKKYGILYSVLPDCNRKDGLSEVIFHTEAVPRVNMMIQKLKFGKIATFDDYLKNGDEKSLGKLMDFLKKQQGNEKSHTIEGDKINSAIDGLIEKVGMFAMEKKAISVDQVKENFSINGEQAESVIRQLETIGVLGSKNEDGTHTVMMDKDAFINRVRGYQDLAERMRAVAASKNANLSDVTISNTTPKGATPSDPFWEKAEGLFLQAIFYYVWLEVQPAKRNFETVLKLLGEAEVTEQGKASKLDVRMKFLEESSPLGANHPAVKQYNKCMRGAGDTVRSIIISANSRLAFLENKQVLRLLSKDELNLSDIGIGVNGDGETKTALFCVIPDSDKSYNFIIGMLYTQIFQELYYQADFNCGGRLPIHVTFMLDEFANVALPDDFCSLLSTMRSREISSIIIIQNFAQLKALFKDTWETIPGNCDTFIYLGGNEQSTHKYVSELLGKGTIDKKSSGETKGRQGSSSRNYDVLGRELFTPDEVRKLDNKKCIIFIRGFDPIMDNKFIPFNHPMFNQTADGKGEPYVHQIRGADNLIGPPFEILSDKAVKYYEKLKDKGENVYIDSLTYEQFMMLGDAELSRRFSMQDEAEQKAKIDREQANELEYVDESQKSDTTESANSSNGSAGGKLVRNPEREKPKWEDTITNRMLHWSYTPEQKEEVKKALAAGVPKATILTYFYPEVTVEKMSSYRKKH